MEGGEQINMKSRNRTCRNDGIGGVHLAKHEYSKRVLIHQHMMSHYRRLYNAKCDVDTSIPTHFKPRYKLQSRPVVSSLPIQNQIAVNDMKFLESLSSDLQMWCDRNGSRNCLTHWEQNSWLENMTNRCTATRLENCKTANCGFRDCQLVPNATRSLSSSNVRLKSKSMKRSESKMDVKKNSVHFSVPSKLRDMSIYHPPRKRVMEKSSCKLCACCPSMNTHHENDVNNYVSLKNNEGKCDLNAEKVSLVMEIQKQKLQYLQFVQDITQDILNKEMFSNDDLEEICRNHVQLNRDKLEMDQMMKQIQILKKQLGINKESNSLNINDNSYRSSIFTDIPGCNPRSYEDISCDDKNKMKCCPIVQEHKPKESVSEENFKRNFGDNKQSIEKKPRICKHNESNIFHLLKSIGFDSDIIEEVCLGMNDEDNMRSTFLRNNTSQSKLDVPDFSGPYEIGEFSGKRDITLYDNRCCSCALQKTSKVCDPNCKNMDKAEKVMRKPHNTQQKESRNSYQSPHDKKVKKNPVVKLRKSVSQKKKESSETLKLSTSSSDVVNVKSDVPKTKTSFLTHVVDNEDLKDSSKNDNNQGNNNENSSAPVNAVSSPVASDYSSMKDHEESVSEVYSVGGMSDEGRESASEVEEEIPDDMSQTTTSSRISQLTEQFKSISVNAGSEMKTNLRSKENKCSFQPLIT